MKVSISAGGRDVEIETSDTNVNPDTIADKALALWLATEGAKDSQGPAYGFTPSGAVASPTSRWIGELAPLPVKAEADRG